MSLLIRTLDGEARPSRNGSVQIPSGITRRMLDSCMDAYNTLLMPRSFAASSKTLSNAGRYGLYSSTVEEISASQPLIV